VGLFELVRCCWAVGCEAILRVCFDDLLDGRVRGLPLLAGIPLTVGLEKEVEKLPTCTASCYSAEVRR
jgi:hypothetical protein